VLLADVDLLAVDAHVVAWHGAVAELRQLAVDLDAPRRDQFLSRTAASDACACDEALHALTR
jgi:hypothetical protein